MGDEPDKVRREHELDERPDRQEAIQHRVADLCKASASSKAAGASRSARKRIGAQGRHQPASIASLVDDAC